MSSKDASFVTISRTNARNVTACAQPVTNCTGLRRSRPTRTTTWTAGLRGSSVLGPVQDKKYRFLMRRKGMGGVVDQPDALAKVQTCPLVHTFGCRSECDRETYASHTCQRWKFTQCTTHKTMCHHVYNSTRRRTRGESSCQIKRPQP